MSRRFEGYGEEKNREEKKDYDSEQELMEARSRRLENIANNQIQNTQPQQGEEESKEPERRPRSEVLTLEDFPEVQRIIDSTKIGNPVTK